MPYRAYRIIFRLTLLKYYKIRGARIGSHTYLGPNVYLDVNHRPGKIIIGKNCYITRNCSILVHSDAFMGGPLHIFKKNNGNRIFGDVVIGDNVFIGFHSVVLPNVKIGNDSVIGAMTLVLDDVPAGSIVAGVPGKVVGSIYDKLDISVSNQK